MKNINPIVWAILRRLFLEGSTNSEKKLNSLKTKWVTSDNWYHVSKLGIQ